MPPYEPQVLRAAYAYLLALAKVHTVKVVGAIPIFHKSYLTKSTFELHRALVWSFKLGEQLPIIGARLKKVPIPDFQKLYEQTSLVTKSIDALGRIGLFMAASPDLKAILVVRHPCGHVASILRGTQEAN